MQAPINRGWLFAGWMIVLVAASPVDRQAQNHSNPPVPYASLTTQPPRYRGPGREAEFDLPGNTIRIALLVPMQGAQKPDGEAIVTAAQLAIKDSEMRQPPGTRRVSLVIGDESGPAWGRVADAMMDLVFHDQAIAIITSANGATAHLCEQVGNRIGVPVLTLSSDSTTTEINLPWIFRLGPSDAAQAAAMASNIFGVRGLRRVLLVTQSNHDGIEGGREFRRAAARYPKTFVDSAVLDNLRPNASAIVAQVRTHPPQAIVFWTDPEKAAPVVQQIRQMGVLSPIFLCEEAGQEGFFVNIHTPPAADIEDDGIWIPASSANTDTLQRMNFRERYETLRRIAPTPVAAQAYDAVTLGANAARTSGANRARLRDQLARSRSYGGVSGMISFDGLGNNQAPVQVVRLF